jgi:predicted chitinase
VPGTNVTLQVMKGLPEVFLPAWAADWNAYLEPLRDADSASYTPTNSVATSNHLNGTACDLDWDSHPFQQRGSFNAAQMATIADMEAFYEGWMFWAGRWDSPVDEMHSQMGYNTWNRNADALNFIARKIRSDGFSTFRRGPLPGDPPAPAVPEAPLSQNNAIKALYDAVPVIDEARAAELVDAVMAGLAAAECNTVNRIAMFLAQCGHESDGFATTEEYASGADYEGRADLGNTHPGDGVKYKGRTWIQITGYSHYAAFGQWCADQGLIDDAAQFINDPASLGDIKWAGIGAAWYWTIQRPDINTLSDAGDVRTVTLRINGGTNGLADRVTRYQQAVVLGDELLALIAPVQGDDPVPEPTPGPDVEQEIWDQLRLRWNMLGGHTLVEAVAQIRDKICGTTDADKQGVQ